jgi:predicted dehydrogenase
MARRSSMRFAAIGLDHRHIFHMVGGLIEAGADCAGFDPTTSDERVLAGFRERFADLAPRSADELLDDPTIELIACAGIPCERAALAIRAMRAGKDVMVDKPGVTTLAQLAEVEACVAETGRIFSVCFSERFIVPATIIAGKLIADGAIGRVVQTIGLGPHRLNRGIRPGWFFDKAKFGGILTDIASHQIDQFLHFTGSSDAEIVTSGTAHFGLADLPDFEDFGEILLRSPQAGGYIRVDWFTADGLSTWGDGRLTILGTEGTIELRKYVDIAGRPGTDHVFLVDKNGTRHIDASREPLTYFRNLVADVGARSETAVGQTHVFTVCRLALEAQGRAVRLPVKSISGSSRA